MKCLLCKTNDLDYFDSESCVRKYFCASCFWNDDNAYDFLEDLVTKQFGAKKETNTELKFPEAKDYPDGFNWFAYDASGNGWFYKEKPYTTDTSWYIKGFEYELSSIFFSSEIVPNWKETLREKPITQTNVINPNYYKWHPVCEAVKITQEFTTNLGCAINYIWRTASPDARKYDSKEGRVQDLQKAIRHLEFEIERIKGDN